MKPLPGRASSKDWQPAAAHRRDRHAAADDGWPAAHGGHYRVRRNIAWPKPTRPGDILRVESEIVDITTSRSKPHQGVVTVRGTMVTENGKAVYVLTAKLLVSRRTI